MQSELLQNILILLGTVVLAPPLILMVHYVRYRITRKASLPPPGDL